MSWQLHFPTWLSLSCHSPQWLEFRSRTLRMTETSTNGSIAETTEQRFAQLRRRMVDQQLVPRGIQDPRVLDAMREVPRHEFVLAQWRDEAYDDWPLPIGFGQTISQPLTVAFMVQALRLTGVERV